MALSTSRLRRTAHPPISYRDESTDDEASNALPTRSSQRLRKTSRRQSSSEDESDTLEKSHAKTANSRGTKSNLSNAARAIRSSRRVRNVANYNEDSGQDSASFEPEVIQYPRPVPKSLRRQRKRPPSNQPAFTKRPFGSFKRRKMNHDNAYEVVRAKDPAVPVAGPGKIPPWQTLPYQILLTILQNASYPFYRDASHDTGSIAWLTNVSLLSKSFRDAAVATILHAPPLFPADRARGLQRLLDAPQETLSTVYRSKVKRFDVEVRNLLIKKSGVDLIALIKQTPLLNALHLYHNHDRVGAVNWAQPSASTGRNWSYPLELFEALDENGIRLKDWTWNGRFPDTKSVLDYMNKIHHRGCVKDVTCLSVLNLAAPGRVKEDEQGTSEDSLTTALDALFSLQELEIKNCSIVNRRVLESLSLQLRHLSIINCGNFNSADLRLYLIERGYQLEDLILNGNQALDLGFAESLESLCPHLRLFQMDLTYSDPTAFHDVDPHYEAVFPGRAMPTWPRTLQTIKIENLRNLDAPDAESFLSSLIAVAPELKDLRKLSINILLQDEGWRERAKLRKTWTPKLKDVFLRQAPPPTPVMSHALRPLAVNATAESSRPSSSHSDSPSPLTTDDSTSATPNKRKSARIAKRELDDLANKALVTTNSTKKKNGGVREVDESDDDDDDDDDDDSHEEIRQRMCSEVTLHIDGQRPADAQFKEDDFLDDERSGDEDWNGRDVEAPSRYAW